MNINLHIEQLVMEGLSVSSEESRALKASLTAELTRMLAEGGISHALIQNNVLSSLPADRIRSLADKDPVRFGRQIGHSVYGGMGHG